MKLIDSILSYLKSNKSKDTKEAPGGLCPNCWGREEYGGNFFEAVKNQSIDVNTNNTAKGWIQDYTEKYLTGIELKHDEDQYVCPKCKISYRKSK